MATIEKYETKGGATLYAVRYRKPDNKQTWKRGFRTQRDAKAFAATVEVSKLRGEYIAPAVGKITVGALGPAWLARQQGHMKPSGFRSYESAWRVHVAPRWADVAIGSVYYTDVAAWVAELASRRGPVIVETAFSVLARILDDAVRDRLLVSNPARGVKLPKRAPRRNVYLTGDQLHRLADESGRYRSLVLLLGVGGLRWGEAAALRVSDVDFLRRRAQLHRNGRDVGPPDVRRHAEVEQEPHGGAAGVRRGCAGADRRGQGPRRAAVAIGHGRVPRAAVIDRFVAVGCGGPLPAGGPDVPAGDRSRTAAHRGVAGDQRRGQPQGGAADAGARIGGDDPRRVRRPV
jgi:hypothetical protein